MPLSRLCQVCELREMEGKGDNQDRMGSKTGNNTRNVEPSRRMH
jgi:hypothetical protein